MLPAPDLVAGGVGSTGDTGLPPHRLLGPDDGVGRAALTHARAVHHVVSGGAGHAGGEGRRPRCTLATPGGHAVDGVGDEDRVDLGDVTRVVPLLTVKVELGLDVDAPQGGLRARYVLADPPCTHPEEQTCASQKVTECLGNTFVLHNVNRHHSPLLLRRLDAR